MATYLGYPFDPEVFDYNWKAEKDPSLTAIVESGAMQTNEEIANPFFHIATSLTSRARDVNP